jgi:hypothetical protein
VARSSSLAALVQENSIVLLLSLLLHFSDCLPHGVNAGTTIVCSHDNCRSASQSSSAENSVPSLGGQSSCQGEAHL